jgi:hypothetical protein
MKKILLTALLTTISTCAFADALYEEIVIPTFVPKEVTIEQNEVMNSEVNLNKQLIENQHITTPKNIVVEDKTIFSNIYYPIITMLGKYKNIIKTIYTDVDGIIIPENDNTTSYQNDIYKTFKKLQKENISVVFTTGRTFKEIKRIANELGMKPKYYITQDGAEIVDANGDLIYSENLTEKERKKLNNEVKWFNMVYKQDVKIVFYIKGQAYTYRNSNVKGLVDVPIIIDDYKKLPKSTSSKIKLYSTDTKNLSLFKRYLKKNYPNLNIYNVTETMIDITSKNATKENAVKHLTNVQNIPLSNSAAFGYSEEDIELMKTIRENGGLAISNEASNDEVKEESSYITKDVQNNGFSFAINTILGNNDILKNSN